MATSALLLLLSVKLISSLQHRPYFPQSKRTQYSNTIKSSDVTRQSFLSRTCSKFVLQLSQNFIILGGTGDLATNKIIPSLFELYRQNILQDAKENGDKNGLETYVENVLENISGNIPPQNVPEIAIPQLFESDDEIILNGITYSSNSSPDTSSNLDSSSSSSSDSSIGSSSDSSFSSSSDSDSSTSSSSVSTDVIIISNESNLSGTDFYPSNNNNNLKPSNNDFTVNLVARSNWTTTYARDKLAVTLLKNKREFTTPIQFITYLKLVNNFLEKCTYTRIESYSDEEAISHLLGVTEGLNNNDKNTKNVENDENTENDRSTENEKRRNILYFALPPNQYMPALTAIRNVRNSLIVSTDDNKKNLNNGFLCEIVLEKPIGYDSNSALEILSLSMDERRDNVWCVDHYLCKDLSVGIMPLKFSNIPVISRLFSDFFNSKYFSKCDIIFSDKNILDGRSGYFDGAGIIRDIIQNHLIQLLALICSDTKDPKHTKNLKKSEIISELRNDVLTKIPKMRPSDLIIGQYEGYLSENGVGPGSVTETFASCTVKVRFLFNFLFIFFPLILFSFSYVFFL